MVEQPEGFHQDDDQDDDDGPEHDVLDRGRDGRFEHEPADDAEHEGNEYEFDDSHRFYWIVAFWK